MPKKPRKKRRKKGHYHRGVYNSPIAGECKYRSGWEQKYMEYLDSNPEVLKWSYEKVIIEYVSNQKTKKIRKYYPDFEVEYVDGKKTIIEIKPTKKLQQSTIIKKIKAAQEWCEARQIVYKIITEIELKDMGLL